MQAPIKLLIPFDSLAEAIALLDRDDQIRLRHLLDQHITGTKQSLESHLLERGGQTPLKEGLALTTEPYESGQTSVAIEHDDIIVQQFEEEH